MWLLVFPALCLLGTDPENRPIPLDHLQPRACGLSCEDIVSGYRKNAALFKRSRVTWCYVNHRLPAWYKTKRLTAEYYHLERSLDEKTNPKIVWNWRDYWIDGEKRRSARRSRRIG